MREVGTIPFSGGGEGAAAKLLKRQKGIAGDAQYRFALSILFKSA